MFICEHKELFSKVAIAAGVTVGVVGFVKYNKAKKGYSSRSAKRRTAMEQAEASYDTQDPNGLAYAKGKANALYLGSTVKAYAPAVGYGAAAVVLLVVANKMQERLAEERQVIDDVPDCWACAILQGQG